jgi:histidinol-phosphatase (PHP family)
LIADYHVHTPFCGHAKGKMIEYVESAVKAGLDEIGFSDHLGRYYLGHVQRKRLWDWGMPERDILRYIDEINVLKELYKDRITIRTGLEIDYIEGAEHLVEHIVNQYHFDFLLGSVHCLPAIGWQHISQYDLSIDVQHVYVNYFAAVNAAIMSGLFQSVAHIDFIWRYIKWPEERMPELANYIDKAVSISAATGTCVEINANGYIFSHAAFPVDDNPFELLIDSIQRHVPHITIGSDAHSPEHVAKCFPEIIGMLNNRGIKSISVFDHKEKTQVRLS